MFNNSKEVEQLLNHAMSTYEHGNYQHAFTLLVAAVRTLNRELLWPEPDPESFLTTEQSEALKPTGPNREL